MKVILRLQTNTIASELPIELNKPIVIGRSSKSNHKVPDELMSGTHCKITLRQKKLEVEDLESKNGTYLNGLRIEQAELFVGDEIKIGGTKISIETEKMDAQTVNALTFPGAVRDRQSHGLQLDFAGARMINQGMVGPNGIEAQPTSSANKELEVRKKAKTSIKLSKQEIKLRNKKRASLAQTFDMILLIFSFALPLFASNILLLISPMLMKEHRLLFLFGSIAGCAIIFYLVNFRILKFTLGEKIAGIQTLYETQGA